MISRDNRKTRRGSVFFLYRTHAPPLPARSCPLRADYRTAEAHGQSTVRAGLRRVSAAIPLLITTLPAPLQSAAPPATPPTARVVRLLSARGAGWAMMVILSVSISYPNASCCGAQPVTFLCDSNGSCPAHLSPENVLTIDRDKSKHPASSESHITYIEMTSSIKNTAKAGSSTLSPRPSLAAQHTLPVNGLPDALCPARLSRALVLCPPPARTMRMLSWCYVAHAASPLISRPTSLDYPAARSITANPRNGTSPALSRKPLPRRIY